MCLSVHTLKLLSTERATKRKQTQFSIEKEHNDCQFVTSVDILYVGFFSRFGFILSICITFWTLVSSLCHYAVFAFFQKYNCFFVGFYVTFGSLCVVFYVLNVSSEHLNTFNITYIRWLPSVLPLFHWMKCCKTELGYFYTLLKSYLIQSWTKYALNAVFRSISTASYNIIIRILHFLIIFCIKRSLEW